MTALYVLADDLSGAAEAAATALTRTPQIAIGLSPASVGELVDHDPKPIVIAIDLDTRTLAVADIDEVVRAAIELAPRAATFMVKIDSLLRGRPDQLVAAIQQALRSSHAVTTVVAPANPATGRTVCGGRMFVGGVELSKTELWHAEPTSPTQTVAEAIGHPSARLIDLDTVRGPSEVLAAALLSCVGSDVVCDGETDDDLDAIVNAAAGLPSVLLVGSGGLAAAVTRSIPPDETTTNVAPTGPCESILVVVGSAAPSVSAEVDELNQLGASTFTVPMADLVHGSAVGLLPTEITAGTTVVRPTSDRVDPAASSAIVAGLATAVVEAAKSADALVLTGGETARAVLNALGVQRLVPVRSVHGAVTSIGDNGQTIVTRPGSFGAVWSLADIVTSLATPTPSRPTTPVTPTTQSTLAARPSSAS